MNVRESQHRWVQMSGTPTTRPQRLSNRNMWIAPWLNAAVLRWSVQVLTYGGNKMLWLIRKQFWVLQWHLPGGLFVLAAVHLLGRRQQCSICLLLSAGLRYKPLSRVSPAVASGICKEWAERSIRGIRWDKLTDLHRKHRAPESTRESELDSAICW